MSHQLHAYDIRFCLGGNTSSKLCDEAPTSPYISYPSYRNSAYMNLGFEVSTSLGLIAAATEESTVKIFDAWTGKEAAVGWRKEKVWGDTVRCLSFTGIDKYGSRMEEKVDQGLLVVHGTTVEEWGD
ncbi:hypothetical protein MMC30_001461 [Trapelia coarctata]|nr:hypothetical protein [Trapelia coarctata]